MEDGEGEGDGRLFPGRSLPDERLPPAQPAFRLRPKVPDQDLARLDAGEPMRFHRMPVAAGEVREDRLSFGLRADRLAVLEAGVHSARASSSGGRASRTTRVL